MFIKSHKFSPIFLLVEALAGHHFGENSCCLWKQDRVEQINPKPLLNRQTLTFTRTCDTQVLGDKVGLVNANIQDLSLLKCRHLFDYR